VTEAPPAARRGGGAAVAAALGVAYLALAALYAWQASQRLSPSIFVDEIELTQVSRSIAETGSAARRGEPFTSQSLYSYVVAPVWWLDDTQRAWEAVKLLGVLLMTTALFPAYALARYVVSRPWAVGAAVASVAAPPLAYAPYLMQEPLAYPVGTLGLWAIAAYVARPGWLRFGLALAVALVGWQVRDQLAVLAGILLVGAAYHGWRGARFRSWRRTWSRWDRVGFALLVLGLAVTVSAAAGHRSERWYVATGFLKQKLVDHGTWAVAAAGLGVGVLPLVAALAVLASPRLHTTPRDRAFVVTGAAALVIFTAYAALKGAFVSTVLGPLVVERNVIYLVPVLFAATAAALSRAAFGIGALAFGAVATLVLLARLPLHLAEYPYFESPALSIGHFANRAWAMPEASIRTALVGAVLVSVALLAVRLGLRRPRHAHVLAGAAVAAVLTWSLTAEVYAARGLNGFSERLYQGTPQPVDWVDRVTGGAPAVYLGQRERDYNEVWLLEFWNRSIERVWSVDGTAPPPTVTPDVETPDGALTLDPDVEWVVARDGVAVFGERVAESGRGMTLYRVERPLRLRQVARGIEVDGWMGASASYSQFASDEGQRGFARVVLSRRGACGDVFPTSEAVVRVGPLAIDENNQSTFARVTHEQKLELRPCAEPTVVARASIPFHVEVTVDPTFVPRELDPTSPDPRSLGAQVSFGFLPLGGG
jgi:hypothetical protein